MMNSVEELWSKIADEETPAGAFRLYDETHPLDLFVGIDPEGRRVLMLVVDQVPQELPAAGVIEVTLNQRNDGSHARIDNFASWPAPGIYVEDPGVPERFQLPVAARCSSTG